MDKMEADFVESKNDVPVHQIFVGQLRVAFEILSSLSNEMGLLNDMRQRIWQ